MISDIVRFNVAGLSIDVLIWKAQLTIHTRLDPSSILTPF